MSEIKEKKNPGLMIAALALLLFSVCFLCVSTVLDQFSFSSLVVSVVEIVISIIAFIYIINGFTKKYEKHFRLYFAISAAAFVLEYFTYAFDDGAETTFFELVFVFVFDMIAYGNCMLLAFGRDLGKKASLSLVWCNLAAIIVIILYYMISSLMNSDSESISYLLLEYAGCVANYIVDILLVSGKYLDKADRGSK